MTLTLSALEKLKKKKRFFEMPIMAQTLNINNLRTKRAESINLHTIRILIEYSLKNVLVNQCLLLPFSKYCCPKVGWYYHPPRTGQGVKGLTKKCERVVYGFPSRRCFFCLDPAFYRHLYKEII